MKKIFTFFLLVTSSFANLELFSQSIFTPFEKVSRQEALLEYFSNTKHFNNLKEILTKNTAEFLNNKSEQELSKATINSILVLREVSLALTSSEKFKANSEKKQLATNKDDISKAIYFINKMPNEKFKRLELKSMSKLAAKYALIDVPLYELLLSYFDSTNSHINIIKFEKEILMPYHKNSSLLIDLFELKLSGDSADIVPEEIKKIPYENRKSFREIISTYLEGSLKKEFHQYTFQDESKKKIKSIYIDHGNDLFSFKNEDREMTGSFRFEFATDLFKMRVFNNLNFAKKLGYQSIFIGGEGYTPFIRYNPELLSFSEGEKIIGLDISTLKNGKYNSTFTQNYLTPVVDTIQKLLDRPFSSFQYIGRAKYRIGIDGNWRSFGQFKLGQMGKNIGRDLQALIHKDINPSIKVLNWDNQIAFPGRLAIQLSNRRDYIFNPKSNKPFFSYGIIEGGIGTYQTYASFGIGLTNKNFKDQSGQKEIKFNSRSPLKNFLFSSELLFKHYWHNSSLEGIGWLNNFNNTAFSDANAQGYILQEKEIKRNILFWNSRISYRTKRVSINFDYFVNTKEFDKLENLLRQKYPNTTLYDYLNAVEFQTNSTYNIDEQKAKTILLKKFLSNNKIFKSLEPQKFPNYGTLGINFYFD
jgi:hypothetical protein